MPAGRPSKYKPEFCQELINMMALGKSIEWVAGHLKVSKDTIYEWAENIPEFSDAKRIGEAQSQKFWEDVGYWGMFGLMSVQDGKLSKVKFNASMWIFNMKNRFKWRDLHEFELPSHAAEQFLESVSDDDTVSLARTNTSSKT